MFLTKRMVTLAFLLAAMGGATQLNAQRARGGGGLGIYGFGPRLGENVQLALENRDHLALSAEQVASLQELEGGIEQDLAPLQAEIDDLRYRIIGGEVGRVEGVTLLQELLADYRAMAAPYQTRVANILTADQHADLQTIMLATQPIPGAGWGVGAEQGLGLSAGMAGGPGLAPLSGTLGGLGRPGGFYAGRGWGRGIGIQRGVRWGTPRGYFRGPVRGWRRWR